MTDTQKTGFTLPEWEYCAAKRRAREVLTPLEEIVFYSVPSSVLTVFSPLYSALEATADALEERIECNWSDFEKRKYPEQYHDDLAPVRAARAVLAQARGETP